MPLPLSRNTNYSPGDSLKSVDLDDIQDQTIGKRHGSVPVMISPFGGQVVAGSFTMTNSRLTADGSTSRVEVPIDLPAGTVITNIKVNVNQAAASPMSWALRYTSDASTGEVVANAGNATLGIKAIDQAISHTIVAGRSNTLRIDVGQASDIINSIELQIQK